MTIKRTLFLLVPVTLFLAVGFKIISKRSSFYAVNQGWSPVHRFEESEAEIVKVTLRDLKVNLPGDNYRGKTGFLEVEVKSSLVGKIVEPVVRLKQ